MTTKLAFNQMNGAVVNVEDYGAVGDAVGVGANGVTGTDDRDRCSTDRSGWCR